MTGSVATAHPGRLTWLDRPGRHMADDYLGAWAVASRAHADLPIAMGAGWMRVIVPPSGEVVSVADTGGPFRSARPSEPNGPR